jgi:hypothetical protein
VTELDDHAARSGGPRRGQLRVYLGAAPGVGKTFAMLNEGHRRKDRGLDVVVGIVETHGRTRTIEQLADLEVVPRKVVTHRGQPRWLLHHHARCHGLARPLVAAGLQVTPIDDMPWGMREFTLTDPSGNNIRIGTSTSDDPQEAP